MKAINLKKAYTLTEREESLRESIAYYEDRRPKKADELKAELATVSEELKTELGKLDAALDEVQKRCTARTIDADRVLWTLQEYFDKLGITKKAAEGIEVRVDPWAQVFPSAYKWDPDSTSFTARYHAGSWIITDIRRTSCSKDQIIATLPEEAQNAILARYTHLHI